MKTTTGRTFFDYISEHSKLSVGILIFFILLVISIILGFLFGNLSLKIGVVEINTKKFIQDPVYVYNTDTIRIQIPIYIEKKGPTDNKRIEIKKGDTSIISSNQSSNINLGGNQNVVHENKGIVGNNNQVTINEEIKRHLDSKEKISLLRLLKLNLKERKKQKIVV